MKTRNTKLFTVRMSLGNYYLQRKELPMILNEGFTEE